MAATRPSAKPLPRLLSNTTTTTAAVLAPPPSSLRLVSPRRCLSHLAPPPPLALSHLRPAASSAHLRSFTPTFNLPTSHHHLSTSHRNLSQAETPTADPNTTTPIQLTHSDHGRTVAELLHERLPTGHPKTFLARLQDGTYLSLHQPIPEHSQSLEALTFNSTDPAARHACWLSSAYLLGIAIQDVLGDRVVLAASPTLNAAGAGGAGFAYEYLLRNGESSTAGGQDASSSSASSSSTSPADAAAKSAIALIDGFSGQPGLTDAEIKQIEKRIEKLASSSLKLQRDSVSLDEARRLFHANPFKTEKVATFVARHGPDERVPIVRIGEAFVDLLPSLDVDAASDLLIANTKPIKAVKISDWSAATWTPSDPSSSLVPPSTQALTRLRAVSFPSSAQLKAHFAARKAALASDHRTIGKAQSLFLTHESSPGTPFILPHGMRLARKVERVVRDLYDIHGYDEVQSPQLYRSWLWKKSGHWDNYRDDMFASEGYKERSERRNAAAFVTAASSLSTMSGIEGRTSCCSIHDGQDNSEGRAKPVGSTSSPADDDAADVDSFGLKPMNCPGHCLIFGSQERSYRDLPIRYAEFSPLHRNEASGSLSGLTRVRRFHQDDAHVFCRPEQVSDEISSMLTMLSSAYETFGFQTFDLVLSTRPSNFIGEISEWDSAESHLKRSLDASGRGWSLNEGDGAFYGPKIDIRLVDAAGRKHQTATIQLDFQLPQRFDLRYTDAQGDRSRPVMIHRAILGSVERFMAMLIEQTTGWWPFWLNPRQAIVLPASRDAEVLQYAEKVRRFLSLGTVEHETPRHRTLQRFYVDLVASSNDKLAKLVRSAQIARYNYILVVGEAELRENTVNVRIRDDTNAPHGIRRLGERDNERESLQDSIRLEQLREAFCRLDRRQSW